MMLIKKNATVTVCHTRTVDMPSVVKVADIVIVAAGRAGVVDDTYLSEGQVVIDVGINVNRLKKYFPKSDILVFFVFFFFHVGEFVFGNSS